MKVIRYGDKKFKNPIAIVGFPTVGLVGSILCSYISREKKMDVIAGITSRDLPPYSLIQNGIPYPPIRIFGYSSETEDCNDILVVTSEISPKPEVCYDLAISVLDILRELNVTRTISIEGAPATEENAPIAICGTVKETIDEIAELGLQKLDEGLVRGITGVMLYEGKNLDMDITAMVCPANPNMPDPRSSARILEPLGKIIPDLCLESGPLFKEAEEMERKIKDEMKHEQNIDVQQIYG